MCSDGAASVMPTANQEWVFVSRPAASGMALTDWDLRDCAMPSLKDGAISSGRTKVIRTPSVLCISNSISDYPYKIYSAGVTSD